MFKRTLKSITVLLVLTVGLSGCGDGDSGTNATEDSPPAIPNVEYSQPDISYFQNTSPKAKSASPNFMAAQSIVLGFSGLSNIGQIYSGFIESAPENEASFNNGVWEWTYSYSHGGASYEMKLTAEESGGSVSWALYWSFDDGQGNSLEDYNLMNGTTQNDGLSGEWTYNSLNPDTNTPVPVLISSWMTDGESEHSIEVQLFDEGSTAAEVVLDYDQDGNDFLMTISYASSSESDIEIYWNPESGLGYIQEGTGERMCWDSSSASVEDVSCSEVGL